MPIRGTDRFRNNFGQNENQQRENSGRDAQILAAENDRRLCADAGRADRMGDGVQGENGRQRPVEIIVQLLENLRPSGILVLQRRDIGRAHREQDSFGYRTDKRHADGQNQKEDEEGQLTKPFL